MTVNHSIGNATLLDSWIRNGASNSNMLANNPTVTGWAGAELISANSTSATIQGHIYRIDTNILGQLINQWVPFQNGGTAEFAYSLHLHDPNASGITTEQNKEKGSLIIYPNPASEGHSIQLDPAKDISIQLFDIQGRLLHSLSVGSITEKQAVSMDISSLNPGLYIYQVNSDSYNEPVRFIVQD